MQRGSLALFAAAALALSIASNAAAATDPFTRSWSATDFDGSLMTLQLTGSGDQRAFDYRDGRATTCGGQAFEARGSAEIAGDVITLSGEGGCVGGAIADFSYELTYEPASGTLSDNISTWYRGNRAREAYLGVWKATDVDGSTMKLKFRSTGQLTRDVTFLDAYASSCGGGIFVSAGEGTIGSTSGQGRFITLVMSGACLGDADFGYAEKYEYVVATDTLFGPLDPDGNAQWYSVTWHRG